MEHQRFNLFYRKPFMRSIARITRSHNVFLFPFLFFFPRSIGFFQAILLDNSSNSEKGFFLLPKTANNKNELNFISHTIIRNENWSHFCILHSFAFDYFVAEMNIFPHYPILRLKENVQLFKLTLSKYYFDLNVEIRITF